MLGGMDNIALAKSELVESLPEDGIAVLPADDQYIDFLREKSRGRVVTFGHNQESDYRVHNVKIENDGNISFSLSHKESTIERIKLNLPGEHNARNAGAALAVAGELGVSLEEAARELETVDAVGSRMRVVKNARRNITVIDDCYNAGPSSMRAALITLRDFPNAKRQVAVLGAMKELGDWTEQEHRKIGALASTCLGVLIGVGDETRSMLEETRMHVLKEWCPNAEEASQKICELVHEGDVVLVKGSRASGLEAVVKALLS